MKLSDIVFGILIILMIIAVYLSFTDIKNIKNEQKIISSYYKNDEIIFKKEIESNKYLVKVIEEGSDTYKEEILILKKKENNEITIDKVYERNN